MHRFWATQVFLLPQKACILRPYCNCNGVTAIKIKMLHQVFSNFDKVEKAVPKGSRHMTDMRVGSLSTDRWVETRLGAKYHDKLPPQNKLVIDGRLPCLYIFRQFFSISKKFIKLIIAPFLGDDIRNYWQTKKCFCFFHNQITSIYFWWGFP